MQCRYIVMAMFLCLYHGAKSGLSGFPLHLWLRNRPDQKEKKNFDSERIFQGPTPAYSEKKNLLNFLVNFGLMSLCLMTDFILGNAVELKYSLLNCHWIVLTFIKISNFTLPYYLLHYLIPFFRTLKTAYPLPCYIDQGTLGNVPL